MKKEKFIAVSQAQVIEYNAFCKYLVTLLDVAERFDGKVLNVRFSKAVNDACERVVRSSGVSVPRFTLTTSAKNTYKYVNGKRVDYCQLDLTFGMANRWVPLGTDDNGVSTGTYIDNGMYLNFFADEGVTSENRICAQAIRDAAVKKVTTIREEVAILLDAIERYDYYDKLVSDLRSEIGERIAEINPLFRAKELTLFATIDQLNKGRKAIVDKVCGQ